MADKPHINIINLTPHPVSVVGGDGKVLITFPPGGEPLRLEEKREHICSLKVDGVEIPVYRKEFGGSNLPPKREGVYYIVSLPIAQSHPERGDFLVPDQLVRDEKGAVIGCRSLATFSRGAKCSPEGDGDG